MKIRKEMIGVLTSSKTLGHMIKVKPEHAEMFAKEGRTDLVDGIPVNILKPKKKNVSSSKSE